MRQRCQMIRPAHQIRWRSRGPQGEWQSPRQDRRSGAGAQPGRWGIMGPDVSQGGTGPEVQPFAGIGQAGPAGGQPVNVDRGTEQLFSYGMGESKLNQSG